MGSDETLLWQRPPRPSRGPKPGLSLDTIVAEAVALADAEGLEALSMKRLATRLDSGVMSLYRYVPGKDELVGLMLDAAFGDPPEIPDGMAWRRAVTICALAMRDSFRAHPWALPICTRAHTVGPNETAWVEAQLKAMSGLEPPSVSALQLILIVSGYVRGAVAPELHAQVGEELRFEFLDRPDTRSRFPLLAQTLASASAETDADFEDFFEFGLERVLDGIAAGFDDAEPSRT